MKDFGISEHNSLNLVWDKFKSEDDAVLAFSIADHERSLLDRREYGALIDRTSDGKYIKRLQLQTLLHQRQNNVLLFRRCLYMNIIFKRIVIINLVIWTIFIILVFSFYYSIHKYNKKDIINNAILAKDLGELIVKNHFDIDNDFSVFNLKDKWFVTEVSKPDIVSCDKAGYEIDINKADGKILRFEHGYKVSNKPINAVSGDIINNATLAEKICALIIKNLYGQTVDYKAIDGDDKWILSLDSDYIQQGYSGYKMEINKKDGQILNFERIEKFEIFKNEIR